MTLESAIMASAMAGLSIGSLFLNILVVIAIVHAKMMQLKSPVYIFSFATIVSDIIMTFLHLLYFAPSCFLQDYLFPQSLVEDGRRSLDLLLLVCWYHGTLSHVLIAIDRFVTVIFYQHPIFTRRRVVVLGLMQIAISISLAVVTQLLFPCCRLSFTYSVYTYTYITIPGVPNYSNVFSATLNSLASLTPLLAYSAIAVVIYRANDNIGRARTREYMCAIQFAIMALIYSLVWVSLRVMPLMLAGTDEGYLYGITTFLTLCNTSTNAVVYLTNNSEIKKSLKSLKSGVQMPTSVVQVSKIITPSDLSAYSILLLNTACVDIVSAICNALCVPMLQNAEGRIIYVFVGPCTAFSAQLCNLFLAAHCQCIGLSTYLLLFSISHRLWMLSPTGYLGSATSARRLWTLVAGVFAFSALNIPFFYAASTYTVPNFNENLTLSALDVIGVRQENWLPQLAFVTTGCPIFVALGAILVRQRTLYTRIQNMTGTRSDRHSHNMIFRALSIQSLLPLAYIGAIALWLLDVVGLVESNTLQRVVFTTTNIFALASPLINMYFIPPYRKYLSSKISAIAPMSQVESNNEVSRNKNSSKIEPASTNRKY